MDIREYDIFPKALSRSPTCFIQKITVPPSSLAILKTRTREDFQLCYLEKSIYSKLAAYPELYPRVYKVNVHESRHMMEFFMEYCEGRDVRAYVEERKTVEVDHAYGLLTQVSKALKVLHGLGIAHNQVNLSNILIAGRVFKLGGFGQAQQLAYVSARGEIRGQRTNQPQFAKDVFDLGTAFLAYFMGDSGLDLTGYSEEEVTRLVTQHLRVYPTEWGLVIQDMLNLDPARRISATMTYERFCSRPAPISLSPSLPSIPHGDTSVSSSTDSLNVGSMNRLRARGDEYQSLSSSAGVRQSLPVMSSSRRGEDEAEDDPFVLAFDSIEVIMRHQNLEEGPLRAKLTNVMRLLDTHKGGIGVNIELNTQKCENYTCRRDVLAWEICKLEPCGHMFCRNCLCAHINRILERTEGWPEFSCLVCNLPFDVFSKNLSGLLYPAVINQIDTRHLSTLPKCPYCHQTYDYSPLDAPYTIKCLKCAKSYCSYCRSKGSHIFSCSKWRRDNKKPR